MKSLILVSLIPLLLVACTTRKPTEKDPRPLAEDFYKKGRLSADYGNYDIALIYYDSAIHLDNSFYAPHQGKRNVYVELEDYDKALEQSKLFISKRELDSTLLMDWIYTGILHEWLGDKNSASDYYQDCLDFYEEQIIKSKEQNSATGMNRAFVLLLLEKDEIAQEVLQDIRTDYPDDSAMIKQLIAFDKTAYIKTFVEGN